MPHVKSSRTAASLKAREKVAAITVIITAGTGDSTVDGMADRAFRARGFGRISLAANGNGITMHFETTCVAYLSEMPRMPDNGKIVFYHHSAADPVYAERQLFWCQRLGEYRKGDINITV